MRLFTIPARRTLRSTMRVAGDAVHEMVGLPEHLVRQVLPSRDDERTAAAKRVGIDVAHLAPHQDSGADELAARGADLLRMSYTVALQPRGEHPAFRRILDDLTPDEGRMLRFLQVAGPQPAIDIRTKRLFGIGSELVASGYSLIARMAGCIDRDQDLEYLANLERLGLVEFSREPVLDPRRYSLIECQPRSMEAMFSSGRPTCTVYRSIHLTALGQRFCGYCLQPGDYDAGGWAEDPRGDRIFMTQRRRGKLARRAGAHQH